MKPMSRGGARFWSTYALYDIIMGINVEIGQFFDKKIRFADSEMLKKVFLNKTGSASVIENRAP